MNLAKIQFLQFIVTHYPHNTSDCLLAISRLFLVGVKSTMKSQLYVNLT